MTVAFNNVEALARAASSVSTDVKLPLFTADDKSPEIEEVTFTTLLVDEPLNRRSREAATTMVSNFTDTRKNTSTSRTLRFVTFTALKFDTSC